MKYYRLHQNVLRSYLAAREYYCDMGKTYDVVAISKSGLWADGPVTRSEKLDTTDCTEITCEQYYQQYEKAKILQMKLKEFIELQAKGELIPSLELERQMRFNRLELYKNQISRIINQKEYETKEQEGQAWTVLAEIDSALHKL